MIGLPTLPAVVEWLVADAEHTANLRRTDSSRRTEGIAYRAAVVAIDLAARLDRVRP